MADTLYLIPGSGLYVDTEQDTVQLIPGGGLYIEQAGDTGSTLLPNELINLHGNLQVLSGGLM